ncbi:lasso peptide biosynthesis PqqD family chaperone [Streptomyces sp. NBC_01803]|uniref:lasso peptide biosynthesis PqqD family chaperone n=1 Tax=Streptomyces sp. NBC_01803 TaxID=2975946 RepID=UPI002DD8BC16|nr:lasso peptide biosynthesis PqqD family chaperone [Streptomyces sp. NBC_01803]WSA43520.1 lasso peptide biosynthesis PqqD family chaperone [Streptomyces sp. NBC_01803]
MSLRLRRDITARDTGTGMVLLDERKGRHWQLNATGALVLRALLGGATPEEAADRLAADRSVAREQATADVGALIERLTSVRLAEPVTDH